MKKVIIEFEPNIGKFMEARQCADLVTLPSDKGDPASLKISLQDQIDRDKGKYMEIGVTFTNPMLNTYKRSYIAKELKKTLDRSKNVLKYNMIAELSEFGRFHYHGIILFKDTKRIDNFRRRLTTKYGRTEVKYIRNEESYVDYMTKGDDCMCKYNFKKT